MGLDTDLDDGPRGFFAPLRNPAITGAMLLSTITASVLLTFATEEVDRRYVQSGGNTNAPVANYEKIRHIINPRIYTNSTLENTDLKSQNK